MTEQLFPILSNAKVKRISETDRRLPLWLSSPTQFPAVNLYELGQNIDEFEEYIDADLRRYMKTNMLIEKLFPVQKILIPSLSRQFESRHYRRPNDICVSSPTGSGKTLAYAVPIVNHLNKSLTRSLRALVVLPSRDLAMQVGKIFSQVCNPTHIRCALAVGDSSESQKLLFRKKSRSTSSNQDEINIFKSLILQDHHFQASHESDQYESLIDILICTPGVLTDLIHNSVGFSLNDLQILILDEADRLITSHKHDWLNTLERSIFSNLHECPCKVNDTVSRFNNPSQYSNSHRVCFSSTSGCAMEQSARSKPIHKLLFSATLSSDPQLLLHMNLFQPRLFLATKPSITGSKIRNSISSQTSTPSSSPVPALNAFVNTRSELLTSSSIPDQLDEKMFVIEAKEKLFVLWYLFHELKYTKVICFTNQVQTSFKLCKFLNEVHGVRAVEFSSNLKPEVRKKYLSDFKSDRIDVIVCTDVMARGMDVEKVQCVISYDMPVSEIFYVHRVGRTARAGNQGTAVTLVDAKDLVLFKRIVQLAHKLPNSMRLSDVVEEMKIPPQIKKSAEKRDLYNKTMENYADKLSQIAKKRKLAH